MLETNSQLTTVGTHLDTCIDLGSADHFYAAVFIGARCLQVREIYRWVVFIGVRYLLCGVLGVCMLETTTQLTTVGTPLDTWHRSVHSHGYGFAYRNIYSHANGHLHPPA